MDRRAIVLSERREEIKSLAARNKAERVSLFGSVARGDDTEDSDYDFLVKFRPGASLLDLSALRRSLSDLLGTDVDVVSEGGLPDEMLGVPDEAVVL